MSPPAGVLVLVTGLVFLAAYVLAELWDLWRR
jgi:hypothetical protein